MPNVPQAEPVRGPSLKSALLLNAMAGGWGKGSVALTRLVQVPVLLSALGVEEFGRWLVLASLPAWLSLANLGFGSVAANEMSMAVAAGDLKRARSVFSTTLALLAGVVGAGAILILAGAPFVSWERVLGVPAGRHRELTAAVAALAGSVLLSFSAEAFGGRFRAARKAHHAMLLSSFRPWLELLAMILALHFTTRFDCLALAPLGATVCFLALLEWSSRRAMPELAFSLALVRPSRFRELFRKGIAFQAFPLGNVLLFQGNLLVLEGILGPAAVALFGTARTLVRSVNQLMELVNQAIWPELSHLMGAGDLVRAARLHRAGVGVSVAAACLGVAVLAAAGQTLYGWWTAKTMEIPQHLLLIFLLPIPLNALWFTSSVVHVACNRHEGLAARYVVGACLGVGLCAALSGCLGLEGAALSSLTADLVLLPYVLRRSLELTGDSWGGFACGLARDVRLMFAARRRQPRAAP